MKNGDMVHTAAARPAVSLPSASWDAGLVSARMNHEQELEARLEKIYGAGEVEEPARFRGRRPRGKTVVRGS